LRGGFVRGSRTGLAAESFTPCENRVSLFFLPFYQHYAYGCFLKGIFCINVFFFSAHDIDSSPPLSYRQTLYFACPLPHFIGRGVFCFFFLLPFSLSWVGPGDCSFFPESDHPFYGGRTLLSRGSVLLSLLEGPRAPFPPSERKKVEINCGHGRVLPSFPSFRRRFPSLFLRRMRRFFFFSNRREEETSRRDPAVFLLDPDGSFSLLPFGLGE